MPRHSTKPSDLQQIPTVTQLTADIKDSLADQFDRVWVRGEVSDCTRAGSGHIYFNLKDESARLRCVVWRSTASRLKTELAEGQDIVCQGSIDVYPPRGEYQLIVGQVLPVGIGALQLAFQQLHAKLKARGWFEPERKRPLPPIPQRIALVTSPEGAAIRDFLEVLGRRWPYVEVLVVPTRVQGAGASQEIARALQLANRLRPLPDAIALCRGGGSAEDLWSFNEEVVCRAIVESAAPVITGIGHEIDVTLSDLAADRRALTPSEAAERLAPHRGDLVAALHQARQRMMGLMQQRLQTARWQVDAVAGRAVLARPLAHLRELAMRLDECSLRGRHAIAQRLEQARRVCQVQAGRLESLNPLSVLARGFSLTRTARHPVLADVRHVAVGEEITTRLAKGQLTSRVTAIETAADENP